MTTTLTIIVIAVLYGTYDLFIKLGAGRIDPALGAMMTQIASALTVAAFLDYRIFNKQITGLTVTPLGIVFVVIAGTLIAIGLILLFIILQQPTVRASSALPMILILRNVTAVILVILVFREKLTAIKSIGIAISLLGVYLISL